MLSNSIPGNFYFETFFGELEDETYLYENSNDYSELLHTTHISKPHYNIVKDYTKLDTNNWIDVVSNSCEFSLELTNPNIWTLYFDGSRNRGVGFGFLHIDPHGNKTMISCLLFCRIFTSYRNFFPWALLRPKTD